MLDVRRFFQHEDDGIDSCSAQSMPANDKTPCSDGAHTNVHLVDFSRSELSKSDDRFPQVDDILDRLDTNARAVGAAIARPD
ncbi:MAG: hypothetical protein AAF801_16845 [Pseudomonadota bacterium]